MDKKTSSDSSSNESNDSETKPKMCKDCNVQLSVINKHILRCHICTKTEVTQAFSNRLKTKETTNTEEVKKYSLRRGEVSKAKNEPEVIELIDSDDDNDKSGDSKLLEQTCSVAKKNSDSNDKSLKEKNGLDESSKKREKNQDQYVFKLWNIKHSDLESMDVILNKEENIEDDKNDSNVTENENLFSLKATYLRLCGYLNVPSQKSNDEEKKLIELEFNPGSLFISMIDSDNKIKIELGSSDLLYCACIFHEPLYVLVLNVKEEISRLYLNSLKNLETFNNSYPVTELTESRLVLILKMTKNEVTKVCQLLYEFFKKLPQNEQRRLDIIKLNKSFELVNSIFKYDSHKPEDLEKFLKLYDFKVNKTLLKYPFNEQQNTSTIQITTNDILCLRDGEFLNDNIISFYLKYLQLEVLSEDDRKRTHIFDTFFYQKLTHQSDFRKTKEEMNMSAAQRRYERVKKWTRNVNIFEKDFLIVPINKNAHWYLAIICYPYLTEPVYEEVNKNSTSMETNEIKDETKIDVDSDSNPMSDTNGNSKSKIYDLDFYPKDESADEADAEDSRESFYSFKKYENKTCIKMPIILIFDSLPTCKNKRVIATIREYLVCEWKAKYAQKDEDSNNLQRIPGENVVVLMQHNYFDCGIYLLQYVESFFTNPIKQFNSPMNMTNWFSLDKVKSKRTEIKKIIYEKKKIYEKEKLTIKSEIKTEVKTETESSNRQNLKSLSRDDDLTNNGSNKKFSPSYDDKFFDDDQDEFAQKTKKIFLDENNINGKKNGKTNHNLDLSSNESKHNRIIKDLEKLT